MPQGGFTEAFMKEFILQGFRFLTLCVGGALIGMLMVPAGTLVVLISAIWKTTDKALSCLEKWKG